MRYFIMFELYSCHGLPIFLSLRNSVFDKNDHLVDFSAVALDKGVQIFFNGYLKPLIADNPGSTEGGVPAVKIGPIVEWWSTGFDKDANSTIGKTVRNILFLRLLLERLISGLAKNPKF